MLRAVMFDVDGVLVDSHPAELRFFQNLFLAAGYPEPSPSDIAAYCHLSLLDAIRQLLNTQNAGEIHRLWAMGHDTSLYPMELLRFPTNVASVIADLSLHYRLGIVTNRLRHDLPELLKLCAIESYFSAVVAFGDYTHAKPHPEPLLMGAKLLSVTPQQAIYIGDQRTDVEAAIAAGMKSICLASTPQPAANMTIADFEDLPSAIAALDDSD
jgi:pyrophosphatase PpaX